MVLTDSAEVCKIDLDIENKSVAVKDLDQSRKLFSKTREEDEEATAGGAAVHFTRV